MLQRWNGPECMLLVTAFIMSLVFATWSVLLNNFVVEHVGFTGKEIGALQSLREVPGFMAFAAVYILLFISEQRAAFLFLLLTSLGVMLTGFFPSFYGLCLTTLLMSTGFHYFETFNNSLTLQWVDKLKSAEFFGRVTAFRAVASLLGYALVWVLMDFFGASYATTYCMFGLLGMVMALFFWLFFKNFPVKTSQNKGFVLRRRYWLYYLLTFFSGARRQIFVVFAGFMMVEKFGYSVEQISMLFIINYLFNMVFARKIGSWIGRVGEKRALIFEYLGLIVIFTCYALVKNAHLAAGLYVLDHLFFALAIAVKTYFQKIAAPADIAATASVSFSINHIAAIFLPVILGYVWLFSPSLVFFIGVGFACCSLILSLLIPASPEQGRETILA